MIDLKSSIRSIPNFPIPGIMFRDITTLLQDATAFKETCNIFYERYKEKQISKIVGIDARGFIFGSVLAFQLGIGFVPVRKKGKLPFKTISQKYALEYGTAEVEIHNDAIQDGERVIVIDDLIATGGTILAAIQLLEVMKAEIVECAFVVELTDLKGRDTIGKYDVFSILSFDGE